jgi:hypothetical protein
VAARVNNVVEELRGLVAKGPHAGALQDEEAITITSEVFPPLRGWSSQKKARYKAGRRSRAPLGSSALEARDDRGRAEVDMKIHTCAGHSPHIDRFEVKRYRFRTPRLFHPGVTGRMREPREDVRLSPLRGSWINMNSRLCILRRGWVSGAVCGLPRQSVPEGLTVPRHARCASRDALDAAFCEAWAAFGASMGAAGVHVMRGACGL